jgi:hypothetical protein
VSLEDVQRRVTERVSAWDDGDVAVRVEPGRYDAVHVTVSGRHPTPVTKPADALLVTAADKAHNGLCIAADVRRYGRDFWSTFNAGRDELLWYYTSVEKAVAERLPDSSIAGALHRAVDELVAAAGTTRSHVPAQMPGIISR